jgi:hypothetical protein
MFVVLFELTAQHKRATRDSAQVGEPAKKNRKKRYANLPAAVLYFPRAHVSTHVVDLGGK